jgi:putative nucleotidyltransferase with HDIG domain
MAIDAKDDVTHSHVRRVQAYAVGLARALGVTDEESLKAIEAAALLHDTGKLAIPEHILNKPGKLTAAEFEKMKQHVDIGADILSLVDFPYPVVPIVRAHHENWDGTGYPRGLRGVEIPIGARILSVVDCFDALTSDRPYRARMTDSAALEILVDRRGKMYDPDVVDTFMRVYRDIDVGTADSEQRDVLQRITQARSDAPSAVEAPDGAGDIGASPALLAFVSLSRVASGEATLADVLALGSHLVADLVPGASGAWYVRADGEDKVIAVETFGPSRQALSGLTFTLGERLTGWVCAHGQPILNSDAALDLGNRADAVQPPLKRCMSIPIAVRDNMTAALTLYSPDADAFDGRQGRLIQMIVPHLSVALRAAKIAPDAASEPRADKGAGPLRLVVTR